MPSKLPSTKLKVTKKDEAAFSEVAKLIAASKEKAFQAVNTALIDLYWNIGATISRKIETSEWGDGVVERLAQFIARTEPGLRGFTPRNLFRMRQFYEAYKEDSIVTPLVTQLPWSHHLIILGQSKRVEEREFYIRMAIREREQARAGTSVQFSLVRARHPASAESDTTGDTKISGRNQCISRCVRGGVPRPAGKPCRSGPASRSA
jgi:predicted nuclease of restriction endonuclease-like (RecB) superfamily